MSATPKGAIKNTEHTPTPYGISEVQGSNGTQWVVGRSNSGTQLYYFDHLGDAINKLRELVGDKYIVRAINSHEALLEAAKLAQEYLAEINYEGAITPALFALTKEKIRNAIAQAEKRP